MRRPEEQLHRSIVQWLAVSLPSGWMFWHTPNGGGRSAAEAGILKALGTRAGMPDLFVLGPGRTLIAIEVKAPPATLKNGSPSKAEPRVSPEQLRTINELGANGVPTLIARDLNELSERLRNMGVPLKGRAM